jgi:hypothetical protein
MIDLEFGLMIDPFDQTLTRTGDANMWRGFERV